MTDTKRRGRRGRLWRDMDFERLLEQREHQRVLRDYSGRAAEISLASHGAARALGADTDQPRERGRFARGGRIVRALGPGPRSWSKPVRAWADFAARGFKGAAGLGVTGAAAAAHSAFNANIGDADAEIRRRAKRAGLDPDLRIDRLINDLSAMPKSATGPDGGRVAGPRPSIGSSGRRNIGSDDRASFTNANAIAAAFNDPRYRRDPAYREAIRRKMSGSPVVTVEGLNAGLR